MSKFLPNVPSTPKPPHGRSPTAAAARRLLTGVSLLAISALAPAAAEAAGVETIYSFGGAPNDGASPRGRLSVVVTTKALGPLGGETGFTIYGTTVAGGAGGGSCPASQSPVGCGTVFELVLPPSLPGIHPRGWSETVLYSFPGFLDPDSDGLNPTGGVIFDPGLSGTAAGYLYGTTSGGGASGDGTVFQLFPAPSGTETIVHNFAGAPSDGANPTGGLVTDSAGNLYGATLTGGGSGNGGTVFERGAETTVLHTFSGSPSDGFRPAADLTIASTGALYGTTEEGGNRGGTGCGVSGCGTVFELGAPVRLKGSLGPAVRPYRVLYQFKGGKDGAGPQGAVAIGANGVLYGTTATGGSADMGTVFELTPNAAGTAWTETVLHTFKGSDGAFPFGDIVIGPDGALYGTTYVGGSANLGTVFELSPAGNTWTLTVLHSFTGTGDDGAQPNGLVADSAGKIWGTTQAGGTSGNGTVFTVAP
jgi:uncharacterized repeat protein (TIGR03803 family)